MKDELKKLFTANVERIDLTKEKLNKEDLKEIAELLPKAPKLDFLDLRHDGSLEISLSTTPELINAICEHPSLGNVYTGDYYNSSRPTKNIKIFEEFRGAKRNELIGITDDHTKHNFKHMLDPLLAIVRVNKKLAPDNFIFNNTILKKLTEILLALEQGRETLTIKIPTDSTLFFLANALLDTDIQKKLNLKTLILENLCLKLPNEDIAELTNDFSKIFKSIETLEINDSTLNEIEIKAIHDAIFVSSTDCVLKNIYFKNCTWNKPQAISTLLGILEKQTQSQIEISNQFAIKNNQFILLNNNLDKEQLKIIGLKLAQKTDWQSIDLSFLAREMTSEELTSFIMNFSSNKAAITLNLPKTLSFNREIKLPGSITKINIREVSLFNNSVDWIAKTVLTSKTITHLDLQNCVFAKQITDPKFSEFGKNISNSQLTALDLSHTLPIDKLLVHIESPKLELIKLNGCELKNVDLKTFIKNNSSLKVLELSINATDFLNSNFDSEKLETVKLTKTSERSENDTKNLIAFITKNPSLKSLDLTGWKFSETDSKDLLSFLQDDCPTLTELKIDKNQLYYHWQITQLEVILQRNKNGTYSNLKNQNADIIEAINAIKQKINPAQGSPQIKDAITSFKQILPTFSKLVEEQAPNIYKTISSLPELAREILNAGKNILKTTSATDVDFDLSGFVIELQKSPKFLGLNITDDDVYTSRIECLISENSTLEELEKAFKEIGSKKYQPILYKRFLEKELQKKEPSKEKISNAFLTYEGFDIGVENKRKIVPIVIEFILGEIQELTKAKEELIKLLEDKNKNLNAIIKAQEKNNKSSSDNKSPNQEETLNEINQIKNEIRIKINSEAVTEKFKKLFTFLNQNRDYLTDETASNYINFILKKSFEEITKLKEYYDKNMTEDRSGIQNILNAINIMKPDLSKDFNPDYFYQYNYERMVYYLNLDDFANAQRWLDNYFKSTKFIVKNEHASTIIMRYVNYYLYDINDFVQENIKNKPTEKLSALEKFKKIEKLFNEVINPYAKYLTVADCKIIKDTIMLELSNPNLANTSLSFADYIHYKRLLFLSPIIQKADAKLDPESSLPPNFNYLFTLTKFCIKGLAEYRTFRKDAWREEQFKFLHEKTTEKNITAEAALSAKILKIINDCTGIFSLRNHQEDEILKRLSYIVKKLEELNEQNKADAEAEAQAKALAKKPPSTNPETEPTRPVILTKNQAQWDYWSAKLGSNAQKVLGEIPQELLCASTKQIIDNVAVAESNETNEKNDDYYFEEKAIAFYVGKKHPFKDCTVSKYSLRPSKNKNLENFMEDSKSKFDSALADKNATTQNIANSSIPEPSAPPKMLSPKDKSTNNKNQIANLYPSLSMYGVPSFNENTLATSPPKDLITFDDTSELETQNMIVQNNSIIETNNSDKSTLNKSDKTSSVNKETEKMTLFNTKLSSKQQKFMGSGDSKDKSSNQSSTHIMQRLQKPLKTSRADIINALCPATLTNDEVEVSSLKVANSNLEPNQRSSSQQKTKKSQDDTAIPQSDGATAMMLRHRSN